MATMTRPGRKVAPTAIGRLDAFIERYKKEGLPERGRDASQILRRNQKALRLRLGEISELKGEEFVTQLFALHMWIGREGLRAAIARKTSNGDGQVV